MSIEILGYSAVVLGAISAIPQLYQIFKTKQVRDINFLFFFMRSISSLMYILYGAIKKDYIMIDGFVYSPGSNKRNYIFELEAIIRSLKY
mgnify:CR=1 FL=1